MFINLYSELHCLGICTNNYGCVIGELGVRSPDGKPYPSTGISLNQPYPSTGISLNQPYPSTGISLNQPYPSTGIH